MTIGSKQHLAATEPSREEQRHKLEGQAKAAMVSTAPQARLPLRLLGFPYAKDSEVYVSKTFLQENS